MSIAWHEPQQEERETSQVWSAAETHVAHFLDILLARHAYLACYLLCFTHAPTHLQQPEACKPSKSADVHWDLLLRLLLRRLLLVCGRRGGCCWWWYERVDQHQLCTTNVGRQTDR